MTLQRLIGQLRLVLSSFGTQSSPFLLGVLLLAACATTPSVSAPTSYEFFLNGEPIAPRVSSLHGDPNRPRAGDVIRVEDHRLVLGDPGVYRFFRKGLERLLLETSSGER